MAMHNRFMLPTGIRLGRRFEVEAYLGQGGFGFVSQCRNVQTGERVAIKVNKSSPNVVRTARREIAMLRRLRCLDPDTCNIIKWNGFFFDKEQICLNFELLDQSLRENLHKREYRGLPMTELRPIVHQLTTAFYHLHSLGIAHADLKPDNIMIVDRQQQPLRVKLIDFGLALPSSEFQPGLNMGTTWYKAPELMLHAPFGEAIDMWSLGVTIAELATGRALYPGDEDYDVLNFIIQTQGQPEDEVLDLGECTHFYFKSENNSKRRWRFKTREEFAEDTGYYGMESEYSFISSLDELGQHMVWDTESQSDQRLLVDLIKRMLTLNPDNRITPQEALQHPFFAPSVPQSSHTADLDNIEEAENGEEVQDSEEETPKPSQQGSGYLSTGSENSGGALANVHCRFEGSPADTLSELNQQCSDHHIAGHNRVERSSTEKGRETPDPQEGTPEHSGQSSSDETVERENFHCRIKCPLSNTCKELPEEGKPEPSQQCSGYHTAGPVNRHCRIKGPHLDNCIETQDTEQTPEPSQQCSDYHTAGQANRHCSVEGPHPNTCTEIPDSEEAWELSQQYLFLPYQMSVPENADCTLELPRADEESSPTWIRKRQDVQPKTNADRWLWRLVRWTLDTIYYYLPCMTEWPQTTNP